MLQDIHDGRRAAARGVHPHDLHVFGRKYFLATCSEWHQHAVQVAEQQDGRLGLLVRLAKLI
eukprot:4323342-Prorocentrum_lima.AAC.1